jgi:hypothetical protein
VIGYMVSGTWNTFTLLRSDWKQISDAVIEYNSVHDIQLDGSDDEEEEAGAVANAINGHQVSRKENDDSIEQQDIIAGESCTRFQCYHV